MKLFFGIGRHRPVTVCTDVRDCLPKDKRRQYQDGRSSPQHRFTSICWRKLAHRVARD
jgi:hypothetical protein